MQQELIESKLKEIFSKSYNFLEDDIRSILYYKKEDEHESSKNFYLHKPQTDFINKNIKTNLKIIIYSFTSKKKTAFTIPGLIDPEMLKSFNGITDHITCNSNLYKLNINGELDNNKIKITSKIPNKLLPIFIEKNLINYFNERELTAIYLHEIGHWINYRMYFPKLLLEIIHQIQYLFIKNPLIGSVMFGAGYVVSQMYYETNIMSFFGYFVLFFILTGVCLSTLISMICIKNEYDSDSFAKKMGYGDELINIFNKKEITGFPTTLENDKSISKLTRSSIIMFSLLTPILYSLFWYLKNESKDSLITHPTLQSRSKVLMAETLSYIEKKRHIILEHINEFDLKLIEENLKNSTNINNINFQGILKSFNDTYISYDDFIYVNRKSIFPNKNIF